MAVTPKKTANKSEGEWACIKLQSFCRAKETTNRVKRQLMKWEKIFSNLISNNWLIFKICGGLLKLNSKKTPLITQLKYGLERRFSKKKL